MNCAQCERALPDLLLQPEAIAQGDLDSHLAECPACREQLHALRRTSALLDAWTAPEPSPWFDARMAARLRAEQAVAPESFFERLRSRFLFNTGAQFRPVMAGALAAALVIGGGAAATVSGVFHRQVEMSATVQDLQLIDRNDQALQTMDQLLGDDGNAADDTTQPPPS